MLLWKDWQLALVLFYKMKIQKVRNMLADLLHVAYNELKINKYCMAPEKTFGQQAGWVNHT
jgi:hypothetical protein